MKRIISMFLAILLIFAFASCGADPKETVLDAINKSNELKYLDMLMETTFKTEGLDGMNMDMSIGIKAIKDENDNMTAMAMEILSGGVEMSSVYADGYMYVSAMGVKQKTPMAIEDFIQQAGMQSSVSQMDTRMIKSIEKTGNDTYTIIYDDEYYTKVMQEQASSMFSGNAEAEFDVGDCSVSLENGYLKQTKTSVKANIKANGEEGSIEIILDITYNNPGETFEISAPEDADEYIG